MNNLEHAYFQSLDDVFLQRGTREEKRKNNICFSSTTKWYIKKIGRRNCTTVSAETEKRYENYIVKSINRSADEDWGRCYYDTTLRCP